MNDLYPELEDYIYQYCRQFQTPDELIATKTVSYLSANPSERVIAMMRERGWISDDPLILDMIADGRDALKSRVVKRIWNEHQHELSLNLCPICHKITRSPEARQCRFCFHGWH